MFNQMIIFCQKMDKNLNELNVRSICNITVQNGRYGLSAIQRAVSKQCKHKLAEITCLSITSQLYPQSLPRYCPLRGKSIIYMHFLFIIKLTFITFYINFILF